MEGEVVEEQGEIGEDFEQWEMFLSRKFYWWEEGQ